MPYDYETNKAKLVDATGQMLTTGLFEETQRKHGSSAPPVFKLSEWRKVYVEIADPTEYTAAMELIGSWEHWLALRANPILSRIFDEWLQEVEVKLRSLGVRELMKVAAKTGSPGASAAARWLAEGGYVEDKRMRTKEGRKREEQVKQGVKDRTAADAARLGLSVIK